MPPDRQLHLICGNYATHKHPKVQWRLARHPRFHLHFTPTSASWLNMVERFFRDLTPNRLRRGIFRDVEELIMAIGTYIDRHNESPKPFIWTARAADILEKVKHTSSVVKALASASKGERAKSTPDPIAPAHHVSSYVSAHSLESHQQCAQSAYSRACHLLPSWLSAVLRRLPRRRSVRTSARKPSRGVKPARLVTLKFMGRMRRPLWRARAAWPGMG
jgi:hypothetical protein